MKINKKLAAVAASAAVLFCSVFTALPVKAASSNTINLRIEGTAANILDVNAEVSGTDNLYNIFKRELDKKKITYDAPSSSYGHMINAINGENGVYPVWWHIYVNNEMSQEGIDSIIPKNGDSVVIFIGDDSNILYPTFKFTPASPKAGEEVTVNVSSSYDDYSNYPNVSTATENISGVKLTLGSKTYITDKNGNAVLKVPDDGNFYFSAVKETKDTTHAIVRMPRVGVSVAAAPAQKPQIGTYDSKKLTEVMSGAAEYLLKNSEFLNYNDSLAVSAAGKKVPSKYAENVRDSLENDSLLYPTNIAGMIIGLRAAGYNPENFDGTNLIKKLYSSENIGLTGLNGYTYSLLAFNCGGYEIKNSAKISRESLINSILSYQKSNGAFSLDKTSNTDCDMTAIAIGALAPYKNESKVNAAINKAVNFLSAQQKSDGGFVPSYSKTESSETLSQVIIALSSVGIDPYNDTRFKKNGKTTLDALMAFKNSDGGFSHIIGSRSDDMSTSQTLEALAAYKKLINGKNNIYDLKDINSANVLEPLKVKNPDTGNFEPIFPVVLLSASSLLLLTLLKKKK